MSHKHEDIEALRGPAEPKPPRPIALDNNFFQALAVVFQASPEAVMKLIAFQSPEYAEIRFPKYANEIVRVPRPKDEEMSRYPAEFRAVPCLSALERAFQEVEQKRITRKGVYSLKHAGGNLCIAGLADCIEVLNGQPVQILPTSTDVSELRGEIARALSQHRPIAAVCTPPGQDGAAQQSKRVYVITGLENGIFTVSQPWTAVGGTTRITSGCFQEVFSHVLIG